MGKIHYRTNISCENICKTSMGDRIHFLTDGNSSQPSILWLHGFLGRCQEFEPVVQQFQSEFYCIRIDLPGHGQTQWVGDYSIDRTAQAIVQLVTDLSLSSSIIAGYSMGGRIALHLALNFPELFPIAIVASASPGLQTTAEQQARWQQDVALADRLEANYPQFLRDWYEQSLFASFKQHPSFDAIFQQRSQQQPAELAKCLRGMSTGRQPSGWAQLATHRHPLLLLVGDGDRKFVTINQAMASLTPTAQLHIIPDSGHVIQVEQPDAMAKQIAAFLCTDGARFRE